MSRRKTVSRVTSPKGGIDAEDLDFKTVKEDWNEYELEDGTIIRAKMVVGKISRGIDPKTGKAYFLPNGEPFYNIATNMIVIANVPKETLEKLKRG